MVDPVGEQYAGILLGRNVRRLQRAPHVVDISAGELRELGDDVPVVVGKAGAEIAGFIRDLSIR